MKKIQVEAIDHVTLVVRDLEASRRFYVDLLGMEEVARPAFTFEGAWFRAGETWLHLILEHAESGPAPSRPPGELTASRTRHFAFRVRDGFEAAEMLRAAGAPIAAGPKVRPDGAVQVFVYDPDGHVVELSSGPPAN